MKTTRKARSKATAPVEASTAMSEAARLLGALGGRSGRGEAKRRSFTHYQNAGLKAADWRRRPGTFYAEGEATIRALFYCSASREVWAIAPGCHGITLALPRTATILPAEDVPAWARKAARAIEAEPPR